MRITPTRIFTCLLPILILTGWARGGDEPQWETTSEHWYIVELGGGPVGYSRVLAETSDDQYRTTNEAQMRVRRGFEELEVRTRSVFIETHDGDPIEMTSGNTMSQQKITSRFVFTDEGIAMETTQGGRTTKKMMQPPNVPWLTPRAAERYLVERLNAEAETIEFRTMTPEGGITPIMFTGERTGEDVAKFDGREVPVSVWAMEMSSMPGVTITQHHAGDGVMMRQSMGGGIPMNTYIATEQEAKAVLEGGAEVPELMFTLFVKPDEPIHNVDDAQRLIMRVRTKDGTPTDLPTAGAQTVEPIAEDDAVRLTVDMRKNHAAPVSERTDDAFREASAMIDSAHPLVRKLAARATAKVKDDPAAKAEALRGFVYDYISEKGLATAFASASETAQMRTGDCSEHGVLLAAMLRAEGIPSRVAAGLLYIDSFGEASQSFGWHMWTQALIDGAWVDLDATLPQRYTVGHILTSAESLADGSAADSMNAMIRLIGNLEIEIIDVSYE